MAIRIVSDAAAVVIPPNQSSRKYGQQLVLQQQKYANDQRQLQQENMYDRQRLFTQNAMQLQREQERRNQLGQQALADLNAKQVFGAQKADAAQVAQKQKERQAAEKEAQQRAAQLKAQERADDFAGIKSGAFRGKTAAELEATYALETQIDLQAERGELDEAQRADAHRQNYAARSKLREARIAMPSMADRGNENLQYYVPSKRGFVNREEVDTLNPDVEVQVYQDGKLMPTPASQQPQLPLSYEEYIDFEPDKADKSLDAKIAELRDRSLGGGKQYDTDEELENAAYAELKGKYERQRSRAASARQKPVAPAIPPQGGQPAMPPVQAPAQQPEMGMQDLEPTYNEDKTTVASGQPVMPPAEIGQPVQAMPPAEANQPVAQGQPAAAPMRAYHQDGRIFEQSPDGNWKEVKDVASQPIQQADGSMWQQSPTDGAWRQVQPTQVAQPATQPVMQPARPLQPGEEEGGSTFAPKAPVVMQQPTETLPVDQTGMQPPAQNVWAEVAMPEQQKPEEEMADVAASAKQPVVPAAPDFKKLAGRMTDSTDRVVLGKLQSMYDNQTPDIQSAIGVVVDPEADPKMTAQAYLYLKSKGIDISQLAKTKKRQLPGMSGIK
jgi:hypothetical protein